MLKQALFLTLMIFVFPIGAGNAEKNVTLLPVHKVYRIQGPENFQPSGLTIVNHRLYTISDKHDHWIYELDITGDQVRAIPALKIPLPIFSFFRSHDFEGITHDPEGNFYLASEAMRKILRVSSDGKHCEWITPDLMEVGGKAGLFKVKNAYLEGICRISPDTFILCAERQPRGFLEIILAENQIQINAYQSEKSIFQFPDGISMDFTGMCRYNNQIYVLERNAFLVSRLARINEELIETRGWSYRHIETDTLYRYADMTYGKAEGLYIDDNFIYIIIDNNGGSRQNRPGDCRPLLMLFKHPDNF